MKKTLTIIVSCLAGLFSAFSLSTAFPMTQCAFNRYMPVNEACMYSRIAMIIFALVGLLSAIALLVKSSRATIVDNAQIAIGAPVARSTQSRKGLLAWILVIAVLAQIFIIYRTFNIRPEVVIPDFMSEQNATSTQGETSMSGATTTSAKPVASTTSSNPVSPKSETQASSTVVLRAERGVLKLNQTGTFGNFSITPIAIAEDSRCPSDVQCIWAGKTRVLFTVKTPTLNGFGLELEEGKTKSVNEWVVTLVKVLPYPVSTHKTADGEYRLEIKINHMIVD